MFVLLFNPLLGFPTGKWQFPTVPHIAGETMRSAGERALAETLTQGGLKTYFLGNSPCGHAPTEGLGAGAGTLFFHRAQLIRGSPAVSQDAPFGIQDFAWVTKSEVPEYKLRDPGLQELLQGLL